MRESEMHMGLWRATRESIKQALHIRDNLLWDINMAINGIRILNTVEGLH